MDRLRKAWNTITSLGKKSAVTVDPTEVEKLEEFQKRIKSEMVQDLSRRYEHTLTFRYSILCTVQGLLLDFQLVTSEFGQDFAMPGILEAWTGYYTNIGRIIVRVAAPIPVLDNIKNFESKITTCGETLMVLFEVRYQIVSLAHAALDWTHCYDREEASEAIFRKCVSCSYLVDIVVEQELNRLLSPDFQLNFYSMRDELAVKMIDCINENKEELGRGNGAAAMLLKERLCAKVPHHKVEKPPRPTIDFEKFPIDMEFKLNKGI